MTCGDCRYFEQRTADRGFCTAPIPEWLRAQKIHHGLSTVSGTKIQWDYSLDCEVKDRWHEA